ncbi:MAG: hypothetical protein HON76_09135 [Candidatus Scalindua sp.]|nr:hypothetical protein [Candidatus Scalindua sp.]MBT5307062.1 hypothetical protein [Candidatus Scalindua sp.]MBT6047564.1 hypothetical protein [Candidatus Scalindua sp.]MBT6227020.1 hypothetical protein [Candidatus Scalindua sp.]MBT6562680.1 hypothetical protein [Candidatus Scalindua sp.]
MIYNEEILDLFIQSIGQQIESLGDTYQDKVIGDELKLLLLDNVSEDGDICVRPSLLNKQFHLSFSSYKDVMLKYEKGHLYN